MRKVAVSDVRIGDLLFVGGAWFTATVTAIETDHIPISDPKWLPLTTAGGFHVGKTGTRISLVYEKAAMKQLSSQVLNPRTVLLAKT